MLLPKFGYLDPATLREACEFMHRHGKDARPVAGGTDLLVNMKKKVLEPSWLVNLGRIEALKRIDVGETEIDIGAAVTIAEIAEAEAVGRLLPAVAAGARALGTPLIRNLATIGGNIGSARPAADMLPSLIVYGASATLESLHNSRRVDVEALFRGPGITCMEADEILSKVTVPVPGSHCGAGYINLGVRKAQDCNLVNVASFIAMDDTGRSIAAARIALGSVGPTPLRAVSAENELVGKVPCDELFEAAGRAAMEDSRPILDFRGSAEYRRDMVGVLTRRTLGIAYRQIRQS